MTVKIDYDSIPRSYREYLELTVKEGEYLAIDDEVDWDLEMGAICRYADETMSPSPIFNKVKDSPGFRAAEWGFTKSGTLGRPWCRVAPNVGAPLDATLMEIMEAYMHSVENNPVHPPKIVDAKDAPCKENKWVGDEIDLFKLPVPLQHQGDAERMLQSAGVNTCQTPDGKWTNWSINRSAVIDKNTMAGFWIPTTQHNGMIWKQWQEKGEDMPFAIAFGVPPVCAWQSASRVPDYVDEYDVASQMLNAPIEMVKCETNDLLVPATAEIVIEGFVSVSETLMEGPYGEHAGYHFEDKRLPKPRQDITCVTFRNNAILPTAVPAVTPNTTVLRGTSPEQVQALVTSLQALTYRMQELLEARANPHAELIIREFLQDIRAWRLRVQEAFQRLSKDPASGKVQRARVTLGEILKRLEDRVEETLNKATDEQLSAQEREHFYRLLGTFRGLSETLTGYVGNAAAVDWARWREARF